MNLVCRGVLLTRSIWDRSQLGLCACERGGVGPPEAVAIKEGLIPGLGTFRLARYVGLGRAKSLIIRGNMIDGTEAERIGLVDHLVGEETAADEFETLLAEYAATNSAGCRASKQMLLDCFDLGWDAFFHKYLVLQERAVSAPDFAEAMAAYREGRDPRWD